MGQKEQTWAEITGTVLHIPEPGTCDICGKRYWERIQSIGIQDYLVCNKCYQKASEK